MEMKCLQGRVGSSPRLDCCCTIGMRGWRDIVARTSVVHFVGRFSFSLPAGHVYIPTICSPAVAPLEKHAGRPGRSQLGRYWPLAAATFPPDRLRGLRPTAAAATPAVFRMQRIGCQSGIFLLAARVSSMGPERQCPGHRGLVAGARMFCSPGMAR